MEKKELINFYTKKLNRKREAIKDLEEEKNSIDGFKTSKSELDYNILYAEINLIENFILNLE